MRSATAARCEMKAACVTAGILAVVLAAAVRPSAQTSPETLKGKERLRSDWVRADPNGSGDFGGLASKFTPASLTPQAAADMQAGAPRAARPPRTCTPDDKHQTA